VSRSAWLWAAAAVVTVAAAGWQRRTGPSYPWRTRLSLGGSEVAVALPRSHVTRSGARIAVPAAAPGVAGTLFWRRYPTDEPFTAVPLRREGLELAATLPGEPPAGKVAYYLQLTNGADPVRLPPAPGETVILRYNGPVPIGILAPHITVMFLSILIGVRTGLGALFGTAAPRALTLVTAGLLTLGGLVLGPVTQWYAFGALWTGVPFGWDLTDNKTLVMWIGWAAAAAAVLRRSPSARRLVVLAAALMLAVYVVPHSLSGSQLDYSKLPSAAARR
jgi:hypothetical protein